MSIIESPQPSPRTNFSLTTLPSGELLLFGGEYYDGEDTIVYNGVFRYERKEVVKSRSGAATTNRVFNHIPQVAPRAGGMAQD